MAIAAVPISVREQIVVDLDGTLVMTDTFAASLLEALRKHPFCFVVLIAALFRGRAFCKRIAAALGELNVASLPYNEPLIDYLRQQRAYGRHLVLATGADLSIATRVAEHLGIFDEVIGSDGECNVVGAEKLRAIQARIGDVPFTYAGDSRADMKIWLRSDKAILVGAPRSCARQLSAANIEVQRAFERPTGTWKSLVRGLRPHQWAKNILVFVPVLLAHQLWNPLVMRHALLAFLGLSFCASALYVVNDLLDLQADRLHPTKRRRPLASGQVGLGAGLGLGVLVGVTAIGIGVTLPVQSSILLSAYAAASLLYSLRLKRMLFLDVVSLALLYALRVLYGGSATGIKISVWTLAFSLFLFASLATVKRLAELRRVNLAESGLQGFRGYRECDVNQLSSLASAAGYAAVLVLALYINSPEVQLLYRHPQGLWLLCPILIYWISRCTLIANRGDLEDDPVAFALKDRATWAVGLLAAAVLLLST
jgi:HAD superfamily hydrolase (TIGR01549 family)